MIEIKKLAIANRGEVAVRIIRACQELGITSVLLHSRADINTRAYRMSDEQVCIGDSPPSESYLSIEKNIDGVLASGAEALHPGFGFLSENPDFALALKDHKITFIGPSAGAISKMGDKIIAKQIVEKLGIPCLPGYKGEKQDLKTLKAKAEEIGFPLMVKSATGGGGRGLKIIEKKGECEEKILSAKREGLNAFGDDTVFLEKYLQSAKHIEVQIFGDLSGRVVHLFERECSVQRRHQKIVEEALSPSLDQRQRKKITKWAKDLAKEVKYVGAGTVEFLVKEDQIYFLEMNTRLQVEHPVTEWVLGIDLVKAQILTMMNRFSVWDQDLLLPRGHSLECRLYAEKRSGLPSMGKISYQEWPDGPGRRFDYGYESGDEMTGFYDSMMAKIIIWDETRPRAINKMLKTLDQSIIFGVETNIPLLKQILSHPEFIDGSFSSQFIDKYFSEGVRDFERTSRDQKIAEICYQKISGEDDNQALSLIPSPWEKAWSNV